MSIQISVRHDVEMECYVMECADDLYCLRAATYEEAILEAQEIAQEWI
jgi:hypothetical protein